MNIFRYLFLGIISLPRIIYYGIYYLLIGIYTVITIFPRYLIIGIIALLNPKKTNEIKIKGKPLIPIIMMSLSLLVYFFTVFIFFRWSVQKLKIDFLATDIISNTVIIEEQAITSDVTDDNPNDNTNTEETTDNTYYPNDYWDYINVPFMDVNFTELIQKNPHTVAWLKINGTYVNYPVVQYTDNGYYLKHDYNRNVNYNGWIYGDYRDNFNDYGSNTIIYGHNLTNRTLFGSLVWTLNNSWYTNSNNHLIKMSTPSNNTVWKVFSVYSIVSESYYLSANFNSTEEYSTFLNTLKSRSIYDFGTPITTDDKILTLSTCDDTGTKRVVIHAKMVSINYK